MKKFSLFNCLLLALILFSTNVFAFNEFVTHPALTGKAIEQSQLIMSAYLKDNLGFKNSVGEIIFDGLSINQIIVNGATTEDSGTLPAPTIPCSRGLNHFYNPQTPIANFDIKAGGLNDKTILSLDVPYIANIKWATIYTGFDYTGENFNPTPSTGEQKTNERQHYSWPVAREAFYQALKKTSTAERNQCFAYMFRSVGQIVHLLQDMAVPAHVRNDMNGHLKFQKGSKSIGNSFEEYVKQRPNLAIGSISPPVFTRLTDFWDTDRYKSSNGWNIGDSLGNGLAEYTQANFVSDYRLLGATGYPHPVEADGEWGVEKITQLDWEDDFRIYFKKNQGENILHLQAQGFLSDRAKDKGQAVLEATYILDNNCYFDYARKLLPKAIGYSAGVMNYFFRGTLEVTEAYNVEGDGNKITKIIAEVNNCTPNNEAASAGEVFAFARFKANSEATEYSYAVSAAAEDASGQQITSLSRDNPEKMVFDFSKSNLPAGAVDINLHVVFYGTLGKELKGDGSI